MGCKSSKSVGVSSGNVYHIHVKTGDLKLGAGTDANIKLTLHGTSNTGKNELSMKLDNKWKNDFERGKVDKFSVEVEESLTDIEFIEIYQDGFGPNDDWFIHVIMIKNNKSGKEYIFPVHRWIREKQSLMVREFDSFLPQNDPHSIQREKELEVKRNNYKYDTKQRGLLAQVYELPSDELFSIDYLFDIAKVFVEIEVKASLAEKFSGRWDNLTDLENIYKGSNGILQRPKGIEKWKSDREFGKQRLVGCNPAVIRLCTSIPDKFGITDEMLLPELKRCDSIQEAINAKKLFIIDYKILEDIPVKLLERKVCAPIALFFLNSDNDLLPVAIQLYQEKGPENPVFMPSDPAEVWLLAKMWFNNADSNYHQSATHLGFTHLLIEPMAIAANRTLSISHPIHRLLAPHFLYLLAINAAALATLMNYGGFVDENLSMGAIGMLEIITRRLDEWRLDTQGTLPEDLKERGVEDPEVLPNYYYRDDALLLYNAIRDYVARVVNEIYDEPEKLENDKEIQSWAEELVAEAPGGRSIKGIPGNGKFTENDQIIVTISSIIFTSSVQHAAVNFNQYDEYAFLPNYPALLSGEPIKTKDQVTEKEILDVIPEKKETKNMVVLSKVLSTNDTQPLGDFEIKYMYDPIGERSLDLFKKELKKIGIMIEERNSTLDEIDKYGYLHPKQIPNAISI